MAGALGLEKVAPQCGWEALRAIGWTIQVPRPRHPQAATAEEREAFKKKLAAAVAEEAERDPETRMHGGVGGAEPRGSPPSRSQRGCGGHSALKPASSG